jgi:hypothetical protein
MPDFATVAGDVVCYSCLHPVTYGADIQWGEVPNRYCTGDRVRWLHIDGSIAPSFKVFRGYSSWNCGEHNYLDLLAFDGNVFEVKEGKYVTCPHCGSPMYGAAVQIRGGVVKAIKTYAKADLELLLGDAYGQADIIVIEPNGGYVARTDWFDPVVEYADN